MESIKASASLELDKRKMKKDGKYPVKLLVYSEGFKERYKTGIDLTKQEWEKLFKINIRDDGLKIILRRLNLKKEQAQKIIDTLDPFSFLEFEELFFQDRTARKSGSLQELFEEYIQNLEGKGRVGSAGLYRTALNSLLGFKPNVQLKEITKDFLERYECFMLAKEHSPTTTKLTQRSKGITSTKPRKQMSPTTIGIYMRHLRAIINIAIHEKKLMSPDKYPFKGYEIPSSRNVKKALVGPQIKKLLEYSSENIDLQKAKDFWIFSYISNGINFTDICNLKPENIGIDFFSFQREKTKNTRKRDKRLIKVPLTEQTKAIIERWRNTDPLNPYLFPILTSGLTAKQQKYRIQDFIFKVNKAMGIVAKELNISAKVGTYVARHSHSTILKRSGASTEMIRENLGHASVITTENYLDDFEDDVKIEHAKRLTDL